MIKAWSWFSLLRSSSALRPIPVTRRSTGVKYRASCVGVGCSVSGARANSLRLNTDARHVGDCGDLAGVESLELAREHNDVGAVELVEQTRVRALGSARARERGEDRAARDADE